MAHVFNGHSLGNSAGDTYYFAPLTWTDSAGATINNAGAVSSITMLVMEFGTWHL